MGPIGGDGIKEGGHLEAWHFIRKTKSVGQGTGNSNKLMGEKMKNTCHNCSIKKKSKKSLLIQKRRQCAWGLTILVSFLISYSLKT